MDAKRLSQLQLLGEGFKQTLPYQEGKEEILVNLTLGKLIINDNLYDFTEIIDCTVHSDKELDVASTNLIRAIAEADGRTTKTTTNTGSVIGRSIVGGLVGGVPGAIIGGATASKSTTESDIEPVYNTDYTLNITVNNPLHPSEQIHVGSDDNEVNAVISFFKIVLTNKNNIQGLTSKFSNIEQCKNSLLEKTKNVFSELNLEEKYMCFDDKKLVEAYNIFSQAVINFPSSIDIDLLYNILDVIQYNKSNLYGDSLLSAYTKDVKNYVKQIPLATDKRRDEYFDVLIKATDLLSYYIDWHGYSDVKKLVFLPYIEVGNLIENELGESYSKWSTLIWKRGIRLHHALTNGPKKVDFTETIHNIQKYDPMYVEPKKAKTDMGCMVLFSALIIITVTLALL